MNTRTKDALYAFRENRLAVVGVVLLVLMVSFCFIGPLFWKTDQVHTNLMETFLPPGPRRVTGTLSVTSTRRGSTTRNASSPSAALPAEPVAR